VDVASKNTRIYLERSSEVPNDGVLANSLNYYIFHKQFYRNILLLQERTIGSSTQQSSIDKNSNYETTMPELVGEEAW
jgi:hypothetical protein